MDKLQIFQEAYKKMNLKKEEKTPSEKPEKRIKLSEIAGVWWDEESVKTGVPPMIKRRFSGAVDEEVTKAGKNIFTFGHTYFYRHGMDPEKVGKNVQDAASKSGFTATILAKGDNWANFKGSAKTMSAQDSFMWVVASLVRNKKEEVVPEVKPKEEPEVDAPKTHEESADLKEAKSKEEDFIKIVCKGIENFFVEDPRDIFYTTVSDFVCEKFKCSDDEWDETYSDHMDLILNEFLKLLDLDRIEKMKLEDLESEDDN